MSELPPLPNPMIDIHNHVGADDPGATCLLELMDSRNVETTLVLGSPLSPSNDDLAALVARHRDRFVGGAYIDPRKPDAIDHLRHCRAEGLHVVKLFPNFGYYPDDEAFRPFFDVVAELGMGVLSHCGWLTPKAGVSAAYYSHPGRFEKLVRTYTDTPFIMAHMGGIAGFLETVMLTTRTPNTYTDCSPGQGVWVLETAGAMAASIPPDKLLWGMDCYYDEEWFDRQHSALAALGFGPHLDKIYHGNATAIFDKIGALAPR